LGAIMYFTFIVNIYTMGEDIEKTNHFG